MCNDFSVWDERLEMTSNELWDQVTRGILASRVIFKEYPNWGYCISPEAAGHLFEEMTELGIAQFFKQQDEWIDAILDAIPLAVGQTARRFSHAKLTPLDRKLSDGKLYGITMWLSSNYSQWFHSTNMDTRHEIVDQWLQHQRSRGRNWRMFTASDMLCAYNNWFLASHYWLKFHEKTNDYVDTILVSKKGGGNEH